MKTMFFAITLMLFIPCSFAQSSNDTVFSFQKLYWEMNGDNIRSNMLHPRVKMEVDASGNMQYSCVNCKGGVGKFEGHIAESQMAEIVRLVRACNPSTFTIEDEHSPARAYHTIIFYYNNTKQMARGQKLSPAARDLTGYLDRLKDQVKTVRISKNFD